MLCCYTKKEKKTSTVQKENVNENFSTLQTLFFFLSRAKKRNNSTRLLLPSLFTFGKGEEEKLESKKYYIN